MIQIVNNPFEAVIKAATSIYPDMEAAVQFNPTIKFKKILFFTFGCCGFTTFRDNRIPLIDISTNIPFEAIVETMAHELAHIICGPGSKHDEQWSRTFERIKEEYDRLSAEKVGCIGDILENPVSGVVNTDSRLRIIILTASRERALDIMVSLYNRELENGTVRLERRILKLYAYNAIYQHRYPSRCDGECADQVIVDCIDDNMLLARSLLTLSRVPEEYQIIDDRTLLI
jgi:hypothetical protein